jgi:hypothetical protein
VLTESQPRKRKEEEAVDDSIDGDLYFDFDITQLRAKQQEAFMGYMSMDVVDPPVGAIWGYWNNRSVDPSFVESMAIDFVSKLESCVGVYAIPIAVRPHWLYEGTILKHVDGKRLDEVPTIRFTDEGAEAIRDDQLWVLGGNHRRLALAMCIQNLKTELEEKKALVAELRQAEKGKAKAKDTDEDNMQVSSDSDDGGRVSAKKKRDRKRDLRDAEDRISFLEGKLVTVSPKWAILLYNRGECTHTIYENATVDLVTYATQTPSRRMTTTWPGPCSGSFRRMPPMVSTGPPTKNSSRRHSII